MDEQAFTQGSEALRLICCQIVEEGILDAEFIPGEGKGKARGVFRIQGISIEALQRDLSLLERHFMPT
jgi:hypothetical protein